VVKTGTSTVQLVGGMLWYGEYDGLSERQVL
jgi:hypothetical protein